MNKTDIADGQRVRWIAGGHRFLGTVEVAYREGTPGNFALVKPDRERAHWVEIATLHRVTE